MASFDISLDVFSEILSRTDVKTMRMCRILSREFNRLTYESKFMESHKERTKTVCGYLIQSLSLGQFYSTFLDIDNLGDDDRKLCFDFLPADDYVKKFSHDYVRILASVDIGLVFCQSKYPENQYYICKPTTRQWEPMPSPNPEYFATKIAMIVLRSNPLWFKIVRLSDSYGDDCDYIHKRMHCEIFDSNIWAWKQSDDLMLPYYEYFKSGDAISAYGVLHWVTYIRNKYKVLSFHQDKESWESISIPDSCNDDNCYPIRLAAYEGGLAILSSRRGIELVEVWIMKGCNGKKSWDKKYSIDLEGLKKEIGYSFCAVSFYNADTLLILSAYRATFYNFKTSQSHSLVICRQHEYPMLVSFVQTDYEPIQLRQKKKSRLGIILVK